MELSDFDQQIDNAIIHSDFDELNAIICNFNLIELLNEKNIVKDNWKVTKSNAHISLDFLINKKLFYEKI